MDRRAFIGSLALGTLAMPRAALAQPARKVYRIGILGTRSATFELVGPDPRNPYASALLRGLRELGYVYGEHFVTEPRGAEGKPERFPNVGNFTGLSLQLLETTGKRLSLLKELVPAAAPVAILWEPINRLSWQAAENVVRERGWKLLSLQIRDAGEIEGAFKAAIGARAGAILVFPTGLLDPYARRIAELAAKSRLPAMYGLRFYVEAGGLMSYGADGIEIWRRAAVFVDRILKGAKPGDLPVEQPTKFELVINLKAARSIGLTIPQQMLLRADEVIR